MLTFRKRIQKNGFIRKSRSLRRRERSGIVLLIVLVVVALLALGAYTFAEFMAVEAKATAIYGQEVQARALADSGVELVSSLLSKRYAPDPKTYYNEPQMFEGVLLRDSTSARGRGRFSVVSANELDPSGRSIRFGLTDESSKLNLNTMSKLITAGTSLTAAQAETILMALPGMTTEVAEAMLDWMDTDQTAMESGAENDYYQALSPPYPCKDNLLDSLDELLLVKGMTPLLLFGEDSNHNGILDPNENDGAASLPLDNADGILQRGWSAYLTVYSREVNLRTDGTPRININQADLTTLYNEVLADFDEKTAQFILAYRVAGPSGGSGSSGGGSNSSGGSGGNSGSSGSSGNSGSSGSSNSGNSSGGNSSSGGSSGNSGSKSSGSSGSGGNTNSGSSNSSGNSTTKSSGSGSSGSSGSNTTTNNSGSSGSNGSSNNSTTKSSSGSQGSSGGNSSSGGSSGSKSAASSNQKGMAAGSAKAAAASIVGGIDISNGASYTIATLFELPGATTSITTTTGTKQTLNSPWKTTTADLTANLPLIVEKLSLTDAAYIEGRINVNFAPREILVALPGMTDVLADQIVGAQSKSTSGSTGSQLPADRLNAGWLVIDGILTINQLEKIDPFVTGRGDVFHVQSVGYFEGGGPMVRVEAVVDATQDPPQVIFMRDLTELGRGFSAALLSTGSGPTR